LAEVGVIFLLLAAVAGLATVANRIRVPYPILLVISGLALAFVPPGFLPSYELDDPEIVFVLFLPPLLFASAFFTSWRDFKRNIRPIGLLAVGLVLVTVVAVAAVAHYVVGLTWPAAFVLGAIVSPTDAIAATAIAQRLGVPRRIVTLLEGESLLNDATGIVAYRIAAGVAAGAITFSLLGAGLQFVVGAAPFFSGVLAAVAGGLYVGRSSPTIMSPTARLEGGAVWNVVVFLLNGLAFILIGLQFPDILEGLRGEYAAGALLWYAAAVSLAVIVVRMLWVFPATYLPRMAFRTIRERDPAPPWRSVAVISWAGMRGVISLAAALALPESVPSRDLILFLTFNVILATLVLQGLSLPVLIRALGLEDDGSVEREEVRARIESADAALARLEELTEEEWVREDTAERVRGMYGYRRSRFVARKMGVDEDGYEERSQSYQRLSRELLVAQRNALVRLRNEGTISDEALHRIERDLDLEETRLDS
jgi:monovalent cation/hydrogen antiporter